MKKRSLELRVLSGGSDVPADGGSASDELRSEILSKGDLGEVERREFEALVTSTTPQSVFLGLRRGSILGDRHPVVVVRGDGSPSLLRRLPEGITLSRTIRGRLCDGLERLRRLNTLRSGLAAWGIAEGRVWARRTLAEEMLTSSVATLQGTLQSGPDLYRRLGRLALGMLEELERWHDQGLFHGHLSPHNVAVIDDLNAGGDFLFVDYGLAASVLLSATSADRDRLFTEDMLMSFAPELLSASLVTAPADVFGLGKVFDALFFPPNIQAHPRSAAGAIDSGKLERMGVVIAQMTHSDPHRRPLIGAIKSSLIEIFADLSSDDLRPNPKPFDSGGSIFYPRDKDSRQPEHTDGQIPYTSKNAALEDNKASESPKSSIAGGSPDVAQQQMRQSILGVIIAASVLGTGVLAYRVIGGGRTGGGAAIHQELDSFRAAWESMVPSRMLPVARIAIGQGEEAIAAQTVIAQCALEGSREFPGVQSDALRVGHDSRWEQELSHSDRRALFALSAVGVLRNEIPSDLVPPDQLHPGIVYALSASRGQYSSVLEKVPAVLLTQLPGSLGKAFRAVIGDNVNVSSAAPEIRELARISTEGVAEPVELFQFIAPNPTLRLQALAFAAQGFSASQPLRDQEGQGQLSLAKQILRALFEHPNVPQLGEEVAWGKVAGVKGWGISAEDALLLVAGLEPQAQPPQEVLAILFAHPQPRMRAYAMADSLNRVAFGHPAAFKVFSRLKDAAERLSPLLTLQLAQLLEGPRTFPDADFAKWIAAQPPTEILVIMLTESLKAGKDFGIDRRLAVELKLRSYGWDAAGAKLLTTHPDSYIRLYGYRTLAGLAHTGKLSDQEFQTFLKGAIQIEKDAETLELLRSLQSS